MIGNILSTLTRLTGRGLGTAARVVGSFLIWPVISGTGKLIKYIVRDLATLKTVKLIGSGVRLGKDGLIRLRDRLKLMPRAALSTVKKAGEVAGALRVPTPGIGNVVRSTGSKLMNTLKAIPALPGKIRQEAVVKPTREALDDILSLPGNVAQQADNIFRAYLNAPNTLINGLKPVRAAA